MSAPLAANLSAWGICAYFHRSSSRLPGSLKNVSAFLTIDIQVKDRVSTSLIADPALLKRPNSFFGRSLSILARLLFKGLIPRLLFKGLIPKIGRIFFGYESTKLQGTFLSAVLCNEGADHLFHDCSRLVAGTILKASFRSVMNQSASSACSQA